MNFGKKQVTLNKIESLGQESSSALVGLTSTVDNLVNVNAKILKFSSTDSLIILLILDVNTAVLPEPGPARTSKGPSFHSIARFCDIVY